MARARFIRPEFFTDEKVGELPFGARLLFAGIWCHCNMHGVFERSAKLIRSRVFPFDEGVTSAQVAEWLGLLESKGMIARFEADGKTWGAVSHWNEHQSISTREKEIERSLKPEQRWPLPGQTQVCPGTNPGMSVNIPGDASPSPSPSPTPTSGEGAVVRDDLSSRHIQAPPAAEMAQAIAAKVQPQPQLCESDRQRQEFRRLLLRLVVADGAEATRKWWALAKSNARARSFGDKLAMVEWCVLTGRKNGIAVEYASHVIGLAGAWIPPSQGAA